MVFPATSARRLTTFAVQKVSGAWLARDPRLPHREGTNLAKDTEFPARAIVSGALLAPARRQLSIFPGHDVAREAKRIWRGLLDSRRSAAGASL